MRQVLGPGALGRPRGIGWRGRWEGGSGWGTHVTPWLIHVNVWQNPLKCCEVISLQLRKIKEKNKINKIKQKIKAGEAPDQRACYDNRSLWFTDGFWKAFGVKVKQNHRKWFTTYFSQVLMFPEKPAELFPWCILNSLPGSPSHTSCSVSY